MRKHLRFISGLLTVILLPSSPSYAWDIRVHMMAAAIAYPGRPKGDGIATSYGLRIKILDWLTVFKNICSLIWYSSPLAKAYLGRLSRRQARQFAEGTAEPRCN